MSCHIFRSISEAYNKDTVIPFRLMCFARVNSEISRNTVHCGDGICGHWYILRLLTTHTLCKLGHCNSVAVTSLSGVKSEPTVACLANPPFQAISTFSSPKWGPPRAMNHKVYLASCPLTLNQYNDPVDLHCIFYKSSRGISFHMENIGKSVLSLDMYINHVSLLCPLAH